MLPLVERITREVAIARRSDETQRVVTAELDALHGQVETTLTIAGLVNSYHNDGTQLSAAETLRAIADVLGEALASPAAAGPDIRAQALRDALTTSRAVADEVGEALASSAPKTETP